MKSVMKFLQPLTENLSSSIFVNHYDSSQKYSPRKSYYVESNSSSLEIYFI